MMKLVGVLEFTSKYRYGLTSRGAPLYLFRPYDEAQPDYIVGSSERDTSRNQIAVVEVPVSLQEPIGIQKPRGSLVRLLGPVGDFVTERDALLQHYCPHKSAVSEEVADTSDDENRRPIDAEHGWLTFHIDPPGCRDIDDAIAYHHESRTWAITIADAAAAVPIGSVTDCAAKQVGATFYDIEGRVVRSMLPSSVSENTASLLPGERRRGLTLFLGPDGKEHFALTWITVQHSFTYESFVTSAVAFDLHISRDPHIWIEELMIRYNRAAATLLKATGVGLLRVQAEATTEPTISDPELQFLLNEAARYEAATKDTEQLHATLGLYCHASSPLRRYADLLNQRALKAILTHKMQPLPLTNDAIATHLNERATANRRWSRDLTFLTHVTPGRIHTIDVVRISATHVWVPLWRRIIRIRHEDTETNRKGSIRIFCDPTKRNWKQRVMTASA